MKKSFKLAILLVCIVLLFSFSISPCYANLSNQPPQEPDETKNQSSTDGKLSNLSLHNRRIGDTINGDKAKSGRRFVPFKPVDEQGEDHSNPQYFTNNPSLREGDLLHKHGPIPDSGKAFELPSNAGDNFTPNNNHHGNEHNDDKIKNPQVSSQAHLSSRPSIVNRIRKKQQLQPEVNKDVDLLNSKRGVKTTTFTYDIIDSQYDDSPWYDEYIGPDRDQNPDLTRPRTSKKYAWGGRKRVHRKIS